MGNNSKINAAAVLFEFFGEGKIMLTVTPTRKWGAEIYTRGGSCPHIPRELCVHTSGCMVERATHSHPSANWWESKTDKCLIIF